MRFFRKLLVLTLCFQICAVYARIKLEPQDKLSIRFVTKDDDTVSLKDIEVMDDGNIYHPKLGEIEVAGLDVENAEKQIKKVYELKAEENVSNTELSIKKVKRNVSVIGEVKNPGSYSLSNMKTIYDAIGFAKGFTDIADRDQVKLIRYDIYGEKTVINIDLSQKSLRSLNGSKHFHEIELLREGDLIMVPSSLVKKVLGVVKDALKIVSLGVITGAISGAVN